MEQRAERALNTPRHGAFPTLPCAPRSRRVACRGHVALSRHCPALLGTAGQLLLDSAGATRQSPKRQPACAARRSISGIRVSVRPVIWRRRIVDGRRRVEDGGREEDGWRQSDKYAAAPAATPSAVSPAPAAAAPAPAAPASPAAAIPATATPAAAIPATAPVPATATATAPVGMCGRHSEDQEASRDKRRSARKAEEGQEGGAHGVRLHWRLGNSRSDMTAELWQRNAAHCRRRPSP